MKKPKLIDMEKVEIENDLIVYSMGSVDCTQVLGQTIDGRTYQAKAYKLTDLLPIRNLLEQQAKLTRQETLAKALEAINLPSEIKTTYNNASTLMRHRIKNLLQLSK